jgi:dihydrofolate synthase/folylpolyglutamate synthase
LSAYARASHKRLLAPAATDWAPYDRLEAPFLQANASLAHAIAGRMMGLTLAAEVAIAATRLPGRLETLAADPLLVIDIAHTPDAAMEALKGFRHACAEGGALLIGVSQGKKANEIAAILAPAFSRIACVAARHGAQPAESIAAFAGAANPGARITAHDSVGEGLGLLRQEGCAIFAAGSLYVAAEVKAAHLGLDPAALWYF